jgi:hypothetical protein
MGNLSNRKANPPSEVIDDAIRRKDWLSAYSNVTAYFELWGYWLLIYYCRNEKLYVQKRIEDFSVSNLTLVLYLLRLIDQNTFTKMTEAIKKRNAILHAGSRGESKRFLSEKEQEEAIKILENAKYCIDKLKDETIEQMKSEKSLQVT